ncbi:60S ribosomal protein [Plasmodium inui San Antonio 1]|uniref:60S ribosomal protein n=1 Tax=Plasmodium inui San Antonio 1 TaxID=1237626 RepID=W6ZZ93_9APIC|nr:60S ribosomal protein [Plasmodium inui San Antonio 1]EUD64595.1 60S ribosomal protein [Plasmodium inui San Antonio 1]
MAKKSKKSAGDNINAKLQLVMKSGKYQFGRKSCLKALRMGKGKLVIVSSNCPPIQRSVIEYYAMLSKCGVHDYHGDNNDLGTACGKLFRISCLVITDVGDSDIIKTNE